MLALSNRIKQHSLSIPGIPLIISADYACFYWSPVWLEGDYIEAVWGYVPSEDVPQCPDSALTFSPPTRKRSTAAMLTLMFWQRSWRTSRMNEPGRRVMEEQEPSGSITLHWRDERSHGPTEWRLSAWMYGEFTFVFSWRYGNISIFILKNEWAGKKNNT